MCYFTAKCELSVTKRKMIVSIFLQKIIHILRNLEMIILYTRINMSFRGFSQISGNIFPHICCWIKSSIFEVTLYYFIYFYLYHISYESKIIIM